jgi:6,7-dimethyl-8-ribityllumazine synthase
MAEFSGTPQGTGRKVAIAVSRFNEDVTQKLVDGALDALVRHGTALDDIDVVWVPGAWELPVVVRRLLSIDRYDAVVALGAVIRGETPHFDYVAGEASRGRPQAAPPVETPVAKGVLPYDTLEKARAPAGGVHGNKGGDAARAALVIVDQVARLDWAVAE